MKGVRLALGVALSLIAKAALAATIILTSGTTWTVPADWNSRDNTIEVIGPGGTGGGPAFNGSYYGGGGGAYAKITNFFATAGASVSIHFGTIGCFGVTDGTWFDSSSTVYAEGGYPGCNQNGGKSPGGGGTTAASVGTTKYAGGTGGLSGGGGGAAGPNGAGGAAGGNGGAGDNGHGGAGGVGGVGGAGTEFDGTHGSGGGGGGGVTAYAAGNYGAGGGATTVGGVAGTGGLIVITYFSRARTSQGVF